MNDEGIISANWRGREEFTERVLEWARKLGMDERAICISNRCAGTGLFIQSADLKGVIDSKAGIGILS
jgi:predicted methyltransferase